MVVTHHDNVAVEVEHDLPMETRDGTTLKSDVYRPSGSGKSPTLLLRTPDWKQHPR